MARLVLVFKTLPQTWQVVSSGGVLVVEVEVDMDTVAARKGNIKDNFMVRIEHEYGMMRMMMMMKSDLRKTARL